MKKSVLASFESIFEIFFKISFNDFYENIENSAFSQFFSKSLLFLRMQLVKVKNAVEDYSASSSNSSQLLLLVADIVVEIVNGS